MSDRGNAHDVQVKRGCRKTIIGARSADPERAWVVIQAGQDEKTPNKRVWSARRKESGRNKYQEHN